MVPRASARKAVREAAEAPGRNPLDVAFGGRIRERRRAKALSIAALAASSGMSTGALSQIERGLSSPTVRQLWMLSSALGVPASVLVAAEADAAAARDPHVTRPGAEQPVFFQRDGMVKRRVSPEGNAVFQGMVVDIEPGAGSGPSPYTHEADEIGYVLDGTVEIEIDGRLHRLGPGACFAFSSRLPHRFHNHGPRPARVLWVIAKTAPQP